MSKAPTKKNKHATGGKISLVDTSEVLSDLLDEDVSGMLDSDESSQNEKDECPIRSDNEASEVTYDALAQLIAVSDTPISAVTHSAAGDRLMTFQPLRAPMPPPPINREPPKPRKDGSERKERKRYFDTPKQCQNCKLVFPLIPQYSGHLRNCTPEAPWNGCTSRTRSRQLPGAISCGPHVRKRRVRRSEGARASKAQDGRRKRTHSELESDNEEKDDAGASSSDSEKRQQPERVVKRARTEIEAIQRMFATDDPMIIELPNGLRVRSDDEVEAEAPEKPNGDAPLEVAPQAPLVLPNSHPHTVRIVQFSEADARTVANTNATISAPSAPTLPTTAATTKPVTPAIRRSTASAQARASVLAADTESAPTRRTVDMHARAAEALNMSRKDQTVMLQAELAEANADPEETALLGFIDDIRLRIAMMLEVQQRAMNYVFDKYRGAGAAAKPPAEPLTDLMGVPFASSETTTMHPSMHPATMADAGMPLQGTTTLVPQTPYAPSFDGMMFQSPIGGGYVPLMHGNNPF
jgi:hypothetical protein